MAAKDADFRRLSLLFSQIGQNSYMFFAKIVEQLAFMPVDKSLAKCYNIQAVNETVTQQRHQVDSEKVFEKT
jgi:hypothetical protein